MSAHGQWTTKLCGCCDDCETCVYGYYCPACLYGDNHERRTGEDGCGACCAYYWLSLLGLCCVTHCKARKELRHRYKGVRRSMQILPEEPCSDCGVATFCGPCAICQEAREMKNRTAMGDPVRHHSRGPTPVAPPAPQLMMVRPGSKVYPEGEMVQYGHQSPVVMGRPAAKGYPAEGGMSHVVMTPGGPQGYPVGEVHQYNHPH